MIDHYAAKMCAPRAAVRWQPTDSIELNVSGDYSYANNESAAEVITDIDRQLTAGHLVDPDSIGGSGGPHTGVIDETNANRFRKNFITLFDIYSTPATSSASTSGP